MRGVRRRGSRRPSRTSCRRRGARSPRRWRRSGCPRERLRTGSRSRSTCAAGRRRACTRSGARRCDVLRRPRPRWSPPGRCRGARGIARERRCSRAGSCRRRGPGKLYGLTAGAAVSLRSSGIEGWVAAQARVVEVEVHRVEPEPVDAAVEPEARHVEHRVLHGRIVEVEVRLLGQEVVQVVLHPLAVPFPGRAAEHREPVGGRRAVGLRVGPDVPVGPRVVARDAALAEPRMASRRCATGRGRSAP